MRDAAYLAWMRYMDQAVTADPVGSVQVRRRVKMYKALLGARSAVYGDHVELTRISNPPRMNRISAKISLRRSEPAVCSARNSLGPTTGRNSKRFISTRKKKITGRSGSVSTTRNFCRRATSSTSMSTATTCRSLRDPERRRYVLRVFRAAFRRCERRRKHRDAPSRQERKNEHAAAEKISGEVELRGLDAGKTYKVTDYVNQKDYGTVTGPTGKLNVDFTGNFLLEAAPAQ